MSRDEEHSDICCSEGGCPEDSGDEGSKPGDDGTYRVKIGGEDSELPSPETRDTYITLIGAAGISEKLKLLGKMAKDRNDNELIELANTLKWEFGRLCTRAVASSKVKKRGEALAVIANEWQWRHKNLGYDIIHLIHSRCDVSKSDLAVLLGVTPGAVQSGLIRHESKISDQARLFEDSQKHERADLLMDRIYRYIMDPNFPAMDRDKLNAAKGYIELYNKQLERDTSLTWRQVSMVSDWFFSELLPTLQQRLSSSKVNIRQICLELFEKLSGEMREITTQVKLPPDMLTEKDSEKDDKNLNRFGKPKKRAGRKPKGGEKHV